jgi:hypothetical protein
MPLFCCLLGHDDHVVLVTSTGACTLRCRRCGRERVRYITLEKP